MTDPRMVNLAKTLVNYSVEVKPGEWVLILTTIPALPMAQEVLRQVTIAGGNANIFIEDDELNAIVLNNGSDAQIEWLSPASRLLFEQVQVLISLRAPSNTRSLNNIDPAKLQRREIARRYLLETYMQRAAAGDLRWTVTNPPCQSLAQEADMSLREFEDFFYAATFADQPNPVQSWMDFYHMQERLINWLKGKNRVEVRGPSVDLSLSIADRTFINSHGLRNMPDGEIYTGPVEDSINGWVRFTYPAIHKGQAVEGVELEFKDGRVVNARAQKNEAYLLAMLNSDAGARYLGEFAIGTNYGIQRFTKSILFDEKIGGSFHMAIGAGYPETGSVNKSSIHWDFICDMRQDSQILVDGELFYQNGAFVVER
jgi:aminopeptidase